MLFHKNARGYDTIKKSVNPLLNHKNDLMYKTTIVGDLIKLNGDSLLGRNPGVEKYCVKQTSSSLLIRESLESFNVRIFKAVKTWAA